MQRLPLLINNLVSRYHLCTLGAAWTEKVSHESMSRWTERTVGLQSKQEEEGSDMYALGELEILGAYLIKSSAHSSR